MISNESGYSEAFVWIWLPGATKPVVAGKLTADGDKLVFNYGKSYLERKNAISIYDTELPLKAGALPLLPGLSMPACIRDASPDAWGRRVLINKNLGLKSTDADSAQLDELTYLLESGSDRIGALDFQLSAFQYIPRSSENVTLDELLQSAERVEKGIPLTAELDQALYHGSSIGGARPKALIDDSDTKYIAKFSSSTDLFNVLKAEFISTIGENWSALCEEADLTETDHTLLWGRQFLNSFAFDDLEGEYAELAMFANEVRVAIK